jgi:large subunit ribosomal protein L22
MKNDLRVAAEKAWWVACMIRGMSIDEAIRQMDYVKKKSAFYIKQTLMEAQELAVQKHNVEFRSNLWVGE